MRMGRYWHGKSWKASFESRRDLRQRRMSRGTELLFRDKESRDWWSSAQAVRPNPALRGGQGIEGPTRKGLIKVVGLD